MYFLDTNICIYFLKGKFPQLVDRLREENPSRIAIPAMVKTELLLGAEKSNNPESRHALVESFLAPFEIAPFDNRASSIYAEIGADLERKGTIIGPNDLIIAATVLAQDGVLVTHNVDEFRRIPSLPIVDWTVD